MIVTEEEANTKRCQETLAPVGTADRVWHDSAGCIGSACMAWRWAEWKHDPATRKGFCGKAGRVY